MGVAADRVLARIAAISGLRAQLGACPSNLSRRALIQAAHANGAIDDDERSALLAEAA